MYYKNSKEDKNYKSIRQEADNTYVEKPRIEEPVERTVHGVKWSELDFKTQLANMGNRVDGYPTERGLEIVSPEFDIISGVRGLLNIGKATSISTKLKSTYYNKAPWTFKPNPNSYYRAIPKEAIDDAIESGVIRHKPIRKSVEVVKGINFSRGSGSKAGQTFFNKGNPLSSVYSDRYGVPTSHYGDYIIEANDKIPFIPLKPKGRLITEVMENLEKNYNPEIKGLAIPKANVLPEKVIPLDENVKLYKPDWLRGFKEIKTKKYQSGGSLKAQLYAATNRSPDGRPLEQGLKNVYPEMALAGFIRSGIMGLLPSFKKQAVSTVAGITSRQVKDKLIKGLEQATNVGGTINYEVRNAARSAVEKMDREVVKRLPERMQMPVSRTIKRGWNMATSSYGINGQIGTINDIKNK